MNAAKASAAFGGDGPSAPPPSSSSPSSSAVALADASGSAAPAPYKARAARKQITTARLAAIRQEADKSGNTGQAYNIWYNKYSGGEQGDSMGNKTKAQTRCDVARDAGYTRGDSAAVRPYICLFFARGYCPLGSECNHLHRLPAAAGISEQGRDIFGRDKHGDYRDDMGGVGSLQRVNRTLYVGRIIEEADSFSRPQSAGGGGANMPAGGGGWAGGKVLQQAKASSGAGGKLRKEGKEQMSGTERVLRRHFSEWGEIQRIKVLHTRSCAFVTYVHEAQAQFAKEAMSNQSLDHDEVLNVRWATDDPNEGAQKRDRDERESEGRAAIERNLTDEQRAAGAAVRALEMAELEEESDAKRRRLEEEAYAKLVEENERNWAEMEAQEMLRLQAEEEAALQQQTSRFVSREALGGLLALRKEPPPPAPKQSALGGLAAYGSDSEEE